MHVEISVAYNFMLSYLYNKLPRRRVDTFGEELEKGIKKKFEGHWYPDKPFKGSAFRCIRFSGEKVDPVVIYAAASSGLDIDEVKSYLPADLCVWIDPCEVSYRIGEKGAVKILHSDKSEKPDETASSHLDIEIQAANNKGFNPEAQSFKPIDSLSSSLSNLSISPSSPTSNSSWGGSPPLGATAFNSSPQPFPQRAPGNQATMTTAMFAQTKFGSTKLKSAAKRPNRLPTTDLRPRQMMAPGMFPGRPRSLSPRDQAAMEMAVQQQRMLALQQFPGGLSPVSPMADVYVPHQGYVEVSPVTNGPPMNGMLSPADNSKAMLELAAMTYPNQFQHMLLAT